MKQLQAWQGVNPKKDLPYKYVMLKSCPSLSEREIDTWIEKNPPDEGWQEGKYAWAYTEMPVGRIFTWWRRNVLGWQI